MDRHTALEALGLPLDARPDVIRAVIDTRRKRLAAEATFAQSAGRRGVGSERATRRLDVLERAALRRPRGTVDRLWLAAGLVAIAGLVGWIVVADGSRASETSGRRVASLHGSDAGDTEAMRRRGAAARASVDASLGRAAADDRSAVGVFHENASAAASIEGPVARIPERDGPAAWFARADVLARRTDDQGLRESATLFRRAAEGGHVPAMYRYGRALSKRLGVARDSVAAVEWFRKAAERGHALAMNDLGWAYHTGFGVDVDRGEALRWFRNAATNGDAAAMNNYAVMLDRGEAVADDASGALDWYRRAAAGGNATAMYHLGVAFESGEGVERDLERAADWYRRAARAGDPDARAWLEGFDPTPAQ